MTEVPQSIVTTAADAAHVIIGQGILGALLVLSIMGNVALVWGLVRCYRWRTQSGNRQ